MTYSKIRVEQNEDARVIRLALATPKANILDLATMTELSHALDEHAHGGLNAIVIAAEGPHFSFGASVQEHLPEQIGTALGALHGLLRKLAAAPAPTIAAVRGQCLGGGFELVLGCDLIIAEETANFACPEIKLGVFPPAASALLPARIGAARAAHLTITGAGLTGKQAFEAGLVARLVPAGGLDTELQKMIESDFLSRPAVALRYAAQAIRREVKRALEQDLSEIEKLYLQELMSSPDAVEGIRAFLERRQPNWGKAAQQAKG